MVQRNFAFVQFDNDTSAMQAINMENGSNINGRKIIVKTAGLNPKQRPNNGLPMGQNNMPAMPNSMHNMNNINNMNNMQNIPNMSIMHNRARSRSPLSKQQSIS